MLFELFHTVICETIETFFSSKTSIKPYSGKRRLLENRYATKKKSCHRISIEDKLEVINLNE